MSRSRCVVLMGGLALLSSPLPGESLYVASFSGAITSAEGSFAGLCPGGVCDAVTGRLIYDRDLVPATGHVDIGPLEYEYGPGYPGPDVSFADQFQIHVGPYFYDGFSGTHGDYPSFSFDDGVFDGIRLATGVRIIGTSYFELQFSGAEFTGATTDGFGYNTGPIELRGTISPGLTQEMPYESGGSTVTPEPGSFVLLGSGALGFVEMTRRRLRSQ